MDKTVKLIFETLGVSTCLDLERWFASTQTGRIDAHEHHLISGAALRSKRVVDCGSKKNDVNKSLSRRGEEAYSDSGTYGKNFLQRSLSKSRQIFLKKVSDQFAIHGDNSPEN